MAQLTKGEAGYRTPVKKYPEQDNQQTEESINDGATRQDQLQSFNKKAAGTGNDNQADIPPNSSDDINTQ